MNTTLSQQKEPSISMFKMDLENLEGLVDRTSKLFNLCKILEILYKAVIPLNKGKIQDMLEEDLGYCPSDRSMHDYLKQLIDTGLISRIPTGQNTGDAYELLKEINDSGDFQVSKRQLIELKDWKKILECYNHVPCFRDLELFIDIHESRLGLSSDDQQDFSPVILETKTEFPGKEFVDSFYTAIIYQQKIDFEYMPEFDPKKKHPITNFMPYVLKEHKGRWYVAGKFKNGGKIIIFALDRVCYAEFDSKAEEFTRDKFDPDELWEHSMGIFTGDQLKQGKWVREKPIKISFKVKDGNTLENISYLKYAPIHHSQKMKKCTGADKGWVKVMLHMYPEPDLVREIRRIGVHCVKDIEPGDFANQVMEG